MRLESICLVMTGCISPSEKVIELCVKDKDYREQQYINAILFYIENTTIKNIVFCDNSVQPVNEMLCRKAREKRKNFEWLSFQGNYEKTEQLGKGYGEGEILEYVLNNSELIYKCKYMAKITGRLRLLNIDTVLRFLFASEYHFSSYFDEGKHLFIDTRFFVAETDRFRDKFLDAYKNVNDRKGIFYEYAIANRIQERGIAFRDFPLALNIVGDSGSSGYSYRWTWKMLIKKSIPLFYYYFFHKGHLCRAESERNEELIWGEYVWHSNFRELEGKKVVLYGAGKIGNKFYELSQNHCIIIAWVDGNYRKIRRQKGVKITSPTVLDTLVFDYIMIAVKNENVVEQIKDNIREMGISDNKIVWRMPVL